MADVREVLGELNARTIRAEGPIEEVFERARKMLNCGRCSSTGKGYAVLSFNRRLASYSANSFTHLLGRSRRALEIVTRSPG